ncbi:MAG: DUF4433 domain-containing protein [Chloroflexi bacterium]|nr:DUF4433 domain-containing protein [Chloroflexota bacterium]
MPPVPTPIFRMIHLDNLGVCLSRGGCHSPNHEPQDGLTYRAIHNIEIQGIRHVSKVECGPKGVVHDYVPFYFGYLSPMLLQLKTGRVPGYCEGQEPLIYLVSTAQAVAESGIGFVFSDGHGIARFTDWYDDLRDLDKVDWDMVYQRYWKDDANDGDRQRRKQAEFLVHKFFPWNLVEQIAVVNTNVKGQVEQVLAGFLQSRQPVVAVRPAWYYY